MTVFQYLTSDGLETVRESTQNHKNLQKLAGHYSSATFRNQSSYPLLLREILD